MLPIEDFKNVVKHTPLCAIDLIVKNGKGEVLLGLRKNAPAKGLWFAPGGRIFKGERLKDALKRISGDELGVEITVKDVKLLGIYEHIYGENFFGEKGFGTHLVVIACEAIQRNLLLNPPKDQHESYKFMAINEILSSKDVHQYCKNYFIDSPENLFFRCGNY